MRRQKRARTMGPAWLRWGMFLGGSLCMGLAVAVAVQWVVTGSLSIVWEWFVKWPTYLLLTGLLYSAVVFTLGALLGRLWLSAILVGVAGLVLSLVDYFKTAINGTPLELADFGLEIVERVPIQIPATAEDLYYLRTKQQRMGHLVRY